MAPAEAGASVPRGSDADDRSLLKLVLRFQSPWGRPAAQPGISIAFGTLPTSLAHVHWPLQCGASARRAGARTARCRPATKSSSMLFSRVRSPGCSHLSPVSNLRSGQREPAAQATACPHTWTQMLPCPSCCCLPPLPPAAATAWLRKLLRRAPILVCCVDRLPCLSCGLPLLQAQKSRS